MTPTSTSIDTSTNASVDTANGTAPIVIAETDSHPPAGTGPLIVLGNLMVSALVRRLYFEAYDFTDYAFPGPGGWVARCASRTPGRARCPARA